MVVGERITGTGYSWGRSSLGALVSRLRESGNVTSVRECSPELWDPAPFSWSVVELGV